MKCIYFAKIRTKIYNSLQEKCTVLKYFFFFLPTNVIKNYVLYNMDCIYKTLLKLSLFKILVNINSYNCIINMYLTTHLVKNTKSGPSRIGSSRKSKTKVLKDSTLLLKRLRKNAMKDYFHFPICIYIHNNCEHQKQLFFHFFRNGCI